MTKRIMILFMILATAAARSNAQQDTAAMPKDTLSNDENDGKDQDPIPTISIDENDNFTVGTAQNISSSLHAGRDQFLSATAFNFSMARFKVRGYDQDYFSTYMNGVPMENLENGFSTWGLWSGLNDMTRNREGTLGIKNVSYAFGEFGGVTKIDSRASKQRKQFSVNYALSNRTYDNRVVLSYGSGIRPGGWACAFSISGRWANQSYIKGTNYKSLSYFASLEKVFNKNHSLALTVFGAPTKNARSTASVQEAYNLAGTHYYNPNWGYQAGKMRNASVGYFNQPVAILTHDITFNNKSNLLTGVSVSSGYRNLTALNWYNTSDPRPNYYRYLPSYFYANGDTTSGNLTAEADRNNPDLLQIDWDRLIDANRSQNPTTINNADGVAGNTVTGRRAIYIVENRIQKTSNFNLNTTYNTTVNDVNNFSVGASVQKQKTNFYKEVVDLLGGDYFLDVNQFAERDFRDSTTVIQNDVNHPNRLVHEGDKYGYNYDMYFNKNLVWGQWTRRFSRVDVFIAGELSHTSFWRFGNYRVGLYQDNSYGKSHVNHFDNYALKGGITYKLNGRNYVYANAISTTKAPNYNDVYVSLRTRNSQVANPPSERIQSIEGGYIFNSPLIKIRNNYYYTTFKDGIRNFYYYDDVYGGFGNLSLTNINSMHYGTEFSVEAKVYQGLSFTGVAAMGRYYYTSRQFATFTYDNTSQVYPTEVVYTKNYRVGGTPEQAYNMGLNYRGKKFWWVNANYNIFRNAWETISPSKRTANAVDLITEGSPDWHNIVDQKKLYGTQYTIDLSAGWSYKMNTLFKQLKKAHYLVFNASINNIANNTGIKTAGFEQLRYDINNRDAQKFPSKYTYAFGRNYFISVTYRF